MCVYNCRIWDRYQKPVISLALLVDDDPRFRPDRYVRQKSGCRLEFTFPVVKLLDYVLTLPEELSVRFDSDLEAMEEDLHMPYVTSIERHALQKGREEGRQEGRQEGRLEGMVQGAADLLRQAVEIRFGAMPAAMLATIQQCQDVDALRSAAQTALTASSLDELQF